MCDLMRYVTLTTNLTFLCKNKTNSTLPRSLMTTLMALILLLLFGLLSADSPENYLHLIFILSNIYRHNIHLHILFSNYTNSMHFMPPGISKVPSLKMVLNGYKPYL